MTDENGNLVPLRVVPSIPSVYLLSSQLSIRVSPRHKAWPLTYPAALVQVLDARSFDFHCDLLYIRSRI